jgi:hypothetical protein
MQSHNDFLIFKNGLNKGNNSQKITDICISFHEQIA